MQKANNTSKLEINVLFIKPKETPIEIAMPNTQRTINNLVGAPTKTICLETRTKDKVILIYNETKEAGFKNANRYLTGYGMINGNFIIALETKSGHYKSLSKELIIKYTNIFGVESINETDRHIYKLIKARIMLRRKK